MEFVASIKLIIKTFIGLFGLEIKRKKALRTKRNTLEMLKKNGLKPETVIDVGVHSEGTPELYETFPEARHILIEPVEEFERDILEICKKINRAEFIKAAVSNKSGEQKLRIRRTNYINSGLVENDEPEKSYDKSGTRIDYQQKVKVITLDEVYRKYKIEGPCLIKVDVDGLDLKVVEGATRILKETDCIIIEAKLNDISERAQYLEKEGFFIWNMVDFCYYKKGTVFLVDLVFLNNKYRVDLQYGPENIFHDI